MDDILVFTKTHEQHRQVIKEVLDILCQNNLFLKPEKCVFERPEVDYLGMIIGHGQVRMDPAKIFAIQNWPTPKTVKQVQSFLGFANFYCGFIKNFSKIALPLTTLTKKDATWHWTTDQQNTFDTLITALTSEPVLALPRPKGQFRVEANSSNYAVMGLGETLHLSSHKYTGPLSIVKIAKVCTVVVVKGEKCLCK